MRPRTNREKDKGRFYFERCGCGRCERLTDATRKHQKRTVRRIVRHAQRGEPLLPDN